MPLYIKCYRCKEELTEPGAIILSPPEDGWVMKIHLCQECFRRVKLLMEGEMTYNQFMSRYLPKYWKEKEGK